MSDIWSDIFDLEPKCIAIAGLKNYAVLQRRFIFVRCSLAEASVIKKSEPVPFHGDICFCAVGLFEERLLASLCVSPDDLDRLGRGRWDQRRWNRHKNLMIYKKMDNAAKVFIIGLTISFNTKFQIINPCVPTSRNTLRSH